MRFINKRKQKKRIALITALVGVWLLLSIPSVLVLQPLIEFDWKIVKANLEYYRSFGVANGNQLATLFGSSNQPSNTSTSEGSAEGIPVLLYHGNGNGEGSNMSTTVFVEQLRALKAANWQTVTLSQFEDYLAGTTALPAKSFVLTFDDGRTDTFYGADPLLKDLGYTAVMFVVTGYSMPEGGDKALNNFYLNKAELQYMVRSGRWELQSHGAQDHFTRTVPSVTLTSTTSLMMSDAHFLSNKFWLPAANRLETDAEFAERVRRDLEESKRMLETTFGKPVTTFAYPFSDYGQDTANFSGAADLLDAVVRDIYTYSFYQVSPQRQNIFNAPGSTTPMIKRFSPRGDMSGQDLVAVLEAARPKGLPYKSVLGADWRSSWGAVAAVGNELSFSAVPDGNGASALLAGSERWSDYALTARAAADTGSLTLIARYADDGNKAYCTFTGDNAQLVIYRSGMRRVLDTSLSTTTLSAETELGMAVMGSYAACLSDGAVVAATDALDPTLAIGAAGIQTWDADRGAARASIRSFSAAKGNDQLFADILAFARADMHSTQAKK